MTDKPPERIYHVCSTQLSVARRYGGCTYQGMFYHYEAGTDTLIRSDVWRREVRDARLQKRQKTIAEKSKIKQMQLTIDGV